MLEFPIPRWVAEVNRLLSLVSEENRDLPHCSSLYITCLECSIVFVKHKNDDAYYFHVELVSLSFYEDNSHHRCQNCTFSAIRRNFHKPCINFDYAYLEDDILNYIHLHATDCRQSLGKSNDILCVVVVIYCVKLELEITFILFFTNKKIRAMVKQYFLTSLHHY